jgi:iron complex outermembrane recepter protein
LTEHFTLTGGLAFLDYPKRASSEVVLNDPFLSLNLQDVPQFGPRGLPPNLCGALGPFQFFYGQ